MTELYHRLYVSVRNKHTAFPSKHAGHLVHCSLLSAQCKCQVQLQLTKHNQMQHCRDTKLNIIPLHLLQTASLSTSRVPKNPLFVPKVSYCHPNHSSQSQTISQLFSPHSALSTYAVPRRHCLLDPSSLAAKMSGKQITAENKTKQSLLKYLVDAQRKALDRQMSR